MEDYKPFIPNVVASKIPSPVKKSPPIKPYVGSDMFIASRGIFCSILGLSQKFMESNFQNCKIVFGRETHWKTGYAIETIEALLNHACGEYVETTRDLLCLASHLGYKNKRSLLLDEEGEFCREKITLLPKNYMDDYFTQDDYEEIVKLFLPN